MDDPTIKSYFQKDHKELDSLFESFQTRKRCDFDEAKREFEHFKQALFRHIAWEEELLFPLFEAKTGLKAGGPTAVMRSEHQEIKGVLDGMSSKLGQENPDTDEEENLLLAILFQHNRKEEDILYPAIDRLLREEERREIFRKMESMVEGQSDSFV